MDGAKSPEFNLERPAASAAAVLRSIFLAPRSFYRNFPSEGPLREPALFVLLVSTVSGFLNVAANLLLAAADINLWTVAALNLVFVVLSPVAVGVAAGAYLLSIRAFIGPEGSFRLVYRMLAYAYGAMILFWVPGFGALAFTYVAMVLMFLGIRYVYRTSFLTSLVTTLVGFVPVSIAFIYLVALSGLVVR